MADKTPDLTETYLTNDRADTWAREKQRRQESSGAATETWKNFSSPACSDRRTGKVVD